jgi:endonuclease/exonuclease/phosphatase family metal-dependent hydrolase
MPAFSLLTFNCYGVPAPGSAARLALLAQTLNDENVSAVCLQEVQSNRYRRLLERTAARYPHHAYEPFIHAPKGGLLTLTQLPIIDSEFVLYTERGLWYTPALTDWILHKGILLTRMNCGDLPVALINTHLTANYTGEWGRRNPFARHEYNQLQQLAALVKALPAETLVLVCGDFNVPRGSWLYDAFIEASGLRDPLKGDMQPTLRPPRAMPARYAAPIDYALVRAPALPNLKIASRLRFGEKVASAGGQQYLSDHCAVELMLTW